MRQCTCVSESRHVCHWVMVAPQTDSETLQFTVAQHAATHCTTLQHSVTCCNTPQHSATHRNTCLSRDADICKVSESIMLWVRLPQQHQHVTYMNESRHMCEQVMSQIWRRHVTHIRHRKLIAQDTATHRLYILQLKRVMSQIWRRHVTHTRHRKLIAQDTATHGLYKLLLKQVMSQYKGVMSRTQCTLLSYGVATMSRRLKMIGLFRRISSLL